MQLDNALLDKLTILAQESPRKRMHFDLRTSEDDGSQRMLNAILPESDIPIHRHRDTAETVLILRGVALEVFYDNDGKPTHEYLLDASVGNFGVQVPMGVWHALKAVTPCVIMEAKNGSYAPVKEEDLLNL